MANMPSTNTLVRAVQLPLEVVARLQKLAKERKMSVNQLIVFILHEELDKVELTEEDYEWIRSKVKENEEKRKRANG